MAETIQKLQQILMPKAHLIIPGLWLGDIGSALIARLMPEEFRTLNVHEDLLIDYGGFACAKADGKGGWILLTEGLNKAADWIEEHYYENQAILVHCIAGVDRSPMAVIFFLMRYNKMTYDDAWHWVRMHREINNRRDWLDEPLNG